MASLRLTEQKRRHDAQQAAARTEYETARTAGAVVSGGETVTQHQRRRLVALVQANPGSRAEELSARLPMHERSRFGLVLRHTREACTVRVDDDGRVWPA
ncbi:hypothetical protein [Streptomyces sp. NPDC001635]|nr:hypothetical protein E4K10_33195 [Streptomyces sp. T1317-0309]